jgi:hypothetical protein
VERPIERRYETADHMPTRRGKRASKHFTPAGSASSLKAYPASTRPHMAGHSASELARASGWHKSRDQ